MIEWNQFFKVKQENILTMANTRTTATSPDVVFVLVINIFFFGTFLINKFFSKSFLCDIDRVSGPLGST